jgi:hypothetical protein
MIFILTRLIISVESALGCSVYLVIVLGEKCYTMGEMKN